MRALNVVGLQRTLGWKLGRRRQLRIEYWQDESRISLSIVKVALEKLMEGRNAHQLWYWPCLGLLPLIEGLQLDLLTTFLDVVAALSCPRLCMEVGVLSDFLDVLSCLSCALTLCALSWMLADPHDDCSDPLHFC